jgi:hypothetical protein
MHSDKPEDAAFAALVAAQSELEKLRQRTNHREAGRAFALVKTKLDEARLWLDEAVAEAGDTLSAEQN